ncbi:hypothetical protein ACT7C8_00525 [Bacillus cereus]
MTKTETISFRSFMDQSYKKKAHKETNSKNVLKRFLPLQGVH